MASKPVRMRTQRVRGRKVTVKVEQLFYDEDFGYRITLRDDDDDETQPEKWVYGITDEREAELLTSTAVDDLLNNPEPPQWVKTILRDYDIEV